MLIENKYSEYPLYAVSEIVLGILIAINLNTNKEIKTNNDQVDKILTTIFKDLEMEFNPAVIPLTEFNKL